MCVCAYGSVAYGSVAYGSVAYGSVAYGSVAAYGRFERDSRWMLRGGMGDGFGGDECSLIVDKGGMGWCCKFPQLLAISL